MDDELERIRSQRLAETCTWIEDDPNFQRWLSESGLSICLLEGPPGCGKSTLTSRLVESLKTRAPVAYFFCSHSNTQQSWSRIVCTWLWQLLCLAPDLSAGVFNLYAQTVGTTTTETAYQVALQWLLHEIDGAYLILDSLDVNRELQKIAPTTLDFSLRRLATDAKILLISRPSRWSDNVVRSSPTQYTKIIVRPESNSKDIARFVDKEMQRLDWEPSFSMEISERLKQDANGMFLWARFMIDEISTIYTESEVHDALRSLPSGLDDVYRGVLHSLIRLPQRERDMAAKIIQWTACSTRLLTLRELASALAIVPGSAQYDRILNIRSAVRLCAPLLEVSDGDDMVHFVHASALEFMLGLQDEEAAAPGILASMGVSLDRQSPIVAATCLTYLAATKIELGHDQAIVERGRQNEAAKNHLAKYPFYKYVSLNFWQHLPRNEDIRRDRLLQESMRLFFDDELALVSWLQTFQLLGGCRLERVDAKASFRKHLLSAGTITGLRAQQKLGLTASRLFLRWDRYLIEEYFQGPALGKPLAIAAFFDMAVAAAHVLDARKSPDTSDLAPALLLAANGDALETTRLLLQRGADHTFVPEWNFTTLQYARRNCVAVLPCLAALTDLPLDVHRKGSKMGTIFNDAFATISWHPSISRQVLDLATAERLNHRDERGWTPLHNAAGLDTLEVVDMLWNNYTLDEDARPAPEEPWEDPDPFFIPLTATSVRAWAKSWAEHLGLEIDTEQLTRRALVFLGDRIKIELVRMLLGRWRSTRGSRQSWQDAAAIG
jgi:hypothetical protein